MAPRRFPARRARTGVSVVLVLLCAFPRSGPAAGPDPAPIDWIQDYATALESARSRNQLLWIQFTGPWCPNCARMERDTFSDPAVREQAARAFVSVKLRADENQELALGFDLTGLPATVILAPSREVLTVHQGYLAPAELNRLLQSARHRQPPSPEDAQSLASSGKPRGAAAADPDANQRAARPKLETEVALSGYCPVSLVADKRLVQGQTEYTVTHEGRIYRLANRLMFNRFRGEPTRYVPANHGFCPVAQLERGARQAGDPRFGVLCQGRLYLCATAEDRRRFLDEPARYAAIDVAERGNCPHCLASQGREVPGDPRFDLTVDGRRYWFPDSSHREAFLASAGRSPSRQ